LKRGRKRYQLSQKMREGKASFGRVKRKRITSMEGKGERKSYLSLHVEEKRDTSINSKRRES